MARNVLTEENVTSLQRLSFKECGSTSDTDEDIARRVFVCNAIEATTSGLSIAGRITIVSVNTSTWTPLPATALTNRNAIAIQNQSADDIKLQYDAGVSGYVGVLVPSGAERFYDITDDIIIYAKSANSTVDILIEELS